MIQYSIFNFAAPRMPAVEWFTRAAHAVGIGRAGMLGAHTPFVDDGLFRVSLVCHPRLMLSYQYGLIKAGRDFVVQYGRLPPSPERTFDRFLEDYLGGVPGVLGRSFARYEADSCLRVEDLPWAFLELLEVFEVPRSVRNRIPRFDAPGQDPLPPSVHDQIVHAEHEFCARYDYW